MGSAALGVAVRRTEELVELSVDDVVTVCDVGAERFQYLDLEVGEIAGDLFLKVREPLWLLLHGHAVTTHFGVMRAMLALQVSRPRAAADRARHGDSHVGWGAPWAKVIVGQTDFTKRGVLGPAPAQA